MRKKKSQNENRKAHCYRAFGLSIHSDILLPELMPDIDFGLADVLIHYCQQTVDISPVEEGCQHFVITPDQVVLKAVGFSLAVAHGNEITIHCDNPTLYQEAIRLRILGAGIGLLLQQREYLVLHGATIVGSQGAVVIMGSSGEGKSTLTMQLAQRGYRLSGDDKCVMKVDASGIYAVPGSPYVKISDELVKQIGINKNAIHYVSALKNKVYVDLSSNFETDDAPMVAGFVLGRADKTSVQKLTQRQTFDGLFEHSYRKKKLFGAGLHETQFLQCHSMASSVPVYAYSRSLMRGHLQQPEPEFLDLLKDLIGSGR